MGSDDLIKVHEFNGWRCDSCDELITSIEDGWVEWLASEGDRGQEVLRGLRLVHRGSLPDWRKKGCRYDSLNEFRNGKTIVEGLPVERFVGPDGLMMLFSFLAAGICHETRSLSLQNGYKFLATNSLGVCCRNGIPQK